MRIRITNCRAFGPEFKNLLPGSIHETIKPPKGENNKDGVWVMGAGVPVKVLNGEFVTIEKGGKNG